MSYYTNFEGTVAIKDVPKLLHFLQEYNKNDKHTLHEQLEALFRCHINYSYSNSVWKSHHEIECHIINIGGETRYYKEFEILAPYVDGNIYCKGEDGAEWYYKFKNDKCREINRENAQKDFYNLDEIESILSDIYSSDVVNEIITCIKDNASLVIHN